MESSGRRKEKKKVYVRIRKGGKAHHRRGNRSGSGRGRKSTKVERTWVLASRKTAIMFTFCDFGLIFILTHQWSITENVFSQ